LPFFTKTTVNIIIVSPVVVHRTHRREVAGLTHIQSTANNPEKVANLIGCLTSHLSYPVALFIVHDSQCLEYLSYAYQAASSIPARQRLRSTSSRGFIVPRTRTKFGQRAQSQKLFVQYFLLTSFYHLLTSLTL